MAEHPAPRGFAARLPHFESGGDTPRRFLERCLEDVALWEARVQAFTVTALSGARAAADAASQRWAAGRPLSFIDGMPVGIKDIIDTDDMPTRQGSPLYADHNPPFSAASAMALRLAGAVILGKTVTTEFAATSPGPTRNPWDLQRTPGGSSSGSAAAVAAGMVAGALGTQVVGSIIRPAGYCGVVGYKPSLGGINRGGSLDLLSQSCTGVLAASLEDGWAMAREIAARVGGDPGHPGISGPRRAPPPRLPRRLAVLQTPGWTRRNEAAASAFEAALERLRAAGINIQTRDDCPALARLEQGLAQALALTLEINAWEWRWPLNAFTDRDEAALSPATRERAAQAGRMSQESYAAALARRDQIREIFIPLAARFDALISLSAPEPAPVGLHSTGDPVFAVPASLLGIPAVSIPVLWPGSLPLGLQLAGFADGDAALFAHAAAIEALLRPIEQASF